MRSLPESTRSAYCYNWMAALPVWLMASLALISGSEENQLPMVIAVAG